MLDKVDPETGEVKAVEAEIMDDPDFADIDDAPDFDPELDTLMGDLRDVMLMRIRTLRKPWQQMSEAEQTDCANGVELGAKEIIRKTVRMLTSYDWPHTVVSLGQVTIKGEKGIEAKIECSNIQHNREVLGEHVGQMVMVMMVDSDTFMAARAPVQIDRDQPEMLLDITPDDGDLEDPDEDDQAAA